MSLAEAVAADRRVIMLRALNEAQGMTANETILKVVLQQFGHLAGRDIVRAELAWLEEQALVRVEKIGAGDREFWVAHLTVLGDEVALGRTHPGVARRPL